tara:strand:- start:895 stop:1182 length:288 start_codon:yes stop_codon:yes gene_type:complete
VRTKNGKQKRFIYAFESMTGRPMSFTDFEIIDDNYFNKEGLILSIQGQTAQLFSIVVFEKNADGYIKRRVFVDKRENPGQISLEFGNCPQLFLIK